MFPIRDTIPHQHLPVMTLLVIAANVGAFAYELTLPADALTQLITSNGIVPRRYFDGGTALGLELEGADLWPFLTSMFLHGGWLHLITNVWSLWIFGDNVEDRLGPLRYFGLYVGCGLVAGLLHLATNPHSGMPTIGASGAIAGVMGAYFVLFPRAQIVTLVPVIIYPLFLQVPAVLYLGLWFAMQLLSGASSVAGTPAGGVAWWAHIGGFAAGVVWLLVFSGARARRRRVEYVLLLLCSLAARPANGAPGRALTLETLALETALAQAREAELVR